MKYLAESPASDPKSREVIDLIESIHQIRDADPEKRDLQQYAELIRRLCRADSVLLLAAEAEIAVLAETSGAANRDAVLAALRSENIFQRALQNGFAYTLAKELLILVVRIRGMANAFQVISLPSMERARLNEVVLRALLAADFGATGTTEGGGGAHMLSMVDLVAAVMVQEKFGTAALALVNGVVSQFALDFSALCWVVNDAPEVVAISHLDKFDVKSELVQLLVDAAQEALDSGLDLRWPSNSGQSGAQLPGLLQLFEKQGFAHLCALPVHQPNGAISAVLFVASHGADQTLDSVEHLKIGMELLEPRLLDLYRADLAPPVRMVRALRSKLVGLLGAEQLWLKFSVLVFLLLLAASLLIRYPYRVEAPAELSTDAMRVISAQFDGRIDQVLVSAGELVEAGAELAILDTRDLLQQQRETQDEVTRYETELGKARASNDLAEAQISQAKLDEAHSKLQRVSDLILQADNRAPFRGIIVEGERKDLIGAPVKKGERIFKIAQTENLYINLMIPEKEIRSVAAAAEGEMQLLGRPDQRSRFRILSIIPVSVVQGQEGSHFQARALIEQAPEDWWRPGMTGLAKIDAGERQIFWILTHRVLDFLRMKFWF